MKITSDMIEDAVDHINSPSAKNISLEISAFSAGELANILTALANPKTLTYDLYINEIGYGLETLEDVVTSLKEQAKQGDAIYVEVREPQDLDEIGSWTGIYLNYQLSTTKRCFGAGIQLEKEINPLLSPVTVQPVQA